MKALNLASRPFRNERLPSFLALLLVLASLGLTVLHVLAAARVGPANLGKAEGQTRSLEAQLERLRSERATLSGLRPTEDDRVLWGQLRDIVDRRLFRWTLLLSRLEALLPADVRLTAIDPTLRDGQVRLRVSATAATRASPSLQALVRIFADDPSFEDVTPNSQQETPDGDVFVVDMRYLPAPAAAPKPAPPQGERP